MKIRKTMATTGDMKALNLRLPAELHRKLKAKAGTEGKSLNLVIVEILDDGFRKKREATQ